MRKADSLRQWLTAYLPEYKTHPDRLHVWIEGGQVEARRSRTLSFTYRYTLKVGIWEYVGNAEHIMVPLLAWIEKEQPQLLRRDDSQPFGFECELLDGDLSDVLISIDLTEAVVVTSNQAGTGYDIQHPPEVGLVNNFDGVTTSFASIVANGEDIAP